MVDGSRYWILSLYWCWSSIWFRNRYFLVSQLVMSTRGSISSTLVQLCFCASFSHLVPYDMTASVCICLNILFICICHYMLFIWLRMHVSQSALYLVLSAYFRICFSFNFVRICLNPSDIALPLLMHVPKFDLQFICFYTHLPKYVSICSSSASARICSSSVYVCICLNLLMFALWF